MDFAIGILIGYCEWYEYSDETRPVKNDPSSLAASRGPVLLFVKTYF